MSISRIFNILSHHILTKILIYYIVLSFPPGNGAAMTNGGASLGGIPFFGTVFMKVRR